MHRIVSRRVSFEYIKKELEHRTDTTCQVKITEKTGEKTSRQND
jgi:hypothetical protein